MSPVARKKQANRRKAAAGLHIVITAGPTREHVDPVRYMTNESSGRMGFAIAAAAASAGHQVTLIAGPVHLDCPRGVERIDVVSAREMLTATRAAFRVADVLIMAAAVCDWRPARRLAGKWRKKDDGADTATLELVKNPDILATVARNKGRRIVVGFALETGDGVRRARAKMQRKNADLVVLNDPSALGATKTTVTILAREGEPLVMRGRSKGVVAKRLIGTIEGTAQRRQ